MDIIEFFEGIAKKIHEFEESAKNMLDAGKKDEYIKIMDQKAQTLASLSIEIKKYSLSSLNQTAQDFCMQKIPQFSASANNAIRLNSTWYKSQLLFDEDYKNGAPNNFDLFVGELKELNS